MMSITVHIDNNIDKGIEDLQKRIGLGFQTLSEKLRDEIVSNFPNNTGKTAKEFEVRQTGKYNFEVSNPEPAALYVYEGRGPVYAKDARALHFFVNGQEVFVKSVEGTKPNDYITPAINTINSLVNEVVK
ncbi:MAG: hypothetical protein ACOC2W_00805 [bacterium]